MCLFCPAFFFFLEISIHIFVDFPMRSINARIMHGGERYIIHRPPIHERVREWTA